PRVDGEVVRVAHLVGTDEPGPDGPMSIPRLAHRHRRVGPLQIAHRHIVHDEIAGDDGGRVIDRHVAATGADDDAELTLVVDPLRRDGGNFDSRAGTDHTRDLFVEHDWYSRPLRTALGDVIGVVQTD